MQMYSHRHAFLSVLAIFIGDNVEPKMFDNYNFCGLLNLHYF